MPRFHYRSRFEHLCIEISVVRCDVGLRWLYSLCDFSNFKRLGCLRNFTLGLGGDDARRNNFDNMVANCTRDVVPSDRTFLCHVFDIYRVSEG